MYELQQDDPIFNSLEYLQTKEAQKTQTSDDSSGGKSHRSHSETLEQTRYKHKQPNPW